MRGAFGRRGGASPLVARRRRCYGNCRLVSSCGRRSGATAALCCSLSQGEESVSCVAISPSMAPLGPGRHSLERRSSAEPSAGSRLTHAYFSVLGLWSWADTCSALSEICQGDCTRGISEPKVGDEARVEGAFDCPVPQTGPSSDNLGPPVGGESPNAIALGVRPSSHRYAALSFTI